MSHQSPGSGFQYRAFILHVYSEGSILAFRPISILYCLKQGLWKVYDTGIPFPIKWVSISMIPSCLSKLCISLTNFINEINDISISFLLSLLLLPSFCHFPSFSCSLSSSFSCLVILFSLSFLSHSSPFILSFSFHSIFFFLSFLLFFCSLSTFFLSFSLSPSFFFSLFYLSLFFFLSLSFLSLIFLSLFL